MGNSKKQLTLIFFAHSSDFSGANRSLLDLLIELNKRKISSYVVLPVTGPFERKLQENQIAYFFPPNELIEKWHWTCLNNKSQHFKKISLNDIDTYINKFLINLLNLRPDFIISNTITSPWGAIAAEIMDKPHIQSAREYGVLDHNLYFKYGFQESLDALYQTSNIFFTTTNSVANEFFKKKEKYSKLLGGLAPLDRKHFKKNT